MAKNRRFALLVALVLAAGLALLILWKPPWGATPKPAPDTEVASTPTAPAAPTSAATPTPPEAVTPANQPLRLTPATRESDEAAAAGRFAGTVVNWGSGAPVANAELTFSGPGAALTVQTNAEGAFSFVPAELGSYQLATISAEGYLPYAPSWGASDVALIARPRVAITGMVFYLTPAIEYTGRVVDAENSPVAGATVALVSSGAGAFELMPIADRFTSGEDGRFTFSAPDFAVLEARHPSAGRGRAVVDGAVQVSHEMTITVRGDAAFARLGGRVLDSAGSPVADAVVRVAVTTDGPGPALLRAATDNDGAFAVEVPANATYRVGARARGHAPAATTVAVGTEPATVELTLASTAVISGRVLSESGAAVPAFSVAVSRRSGVAEALVATGSFFDGDGRFEISGLAPGDYQVSAGAHGFAPAPAVAATAVLPADEPTPVTITLPVGGTLIGRVTTGESERPLELARVSVEGSFGGGTSALPITSSVVTDADGRFELAGLAPGKASVVASAANHHSQIVGGFVVESGARIGPIQIALTPTKPGERPQIELAGIGAALAANDDGLVIQRLIDGGGALEAGLAVGDVIVAVEGKSVVELGFRGAIQQIRGPVNTPVALGIRRKGETDVVELTAMRRKIRA